MARPPTPIGSWRAISTWVTETDAKGKPVKHKAQARYRDPDGHLRPVSAYGKNKTAAEAALLKKLQDRARSAHAGELTSMHKISDLIDLWEKRFKKLVEIGKRSPTSYDTYERVARNHIHPAIAELRIGEATTQRLDKVISMLGAAPRQSAVTQCAHYTRLVRDLRPRIDSAPVLQAEHVLAAPPSAVSTARNHVLHRPRCPLEGMLGVQRLPSSAS